MINLIIDLIDYPNKKKITNFFKKSLIKKFKYNRYWSSQREKQ